MKTYVINLDRRPDRLVSVTKRFEQVGIELTPFKAVDARDLDMTEKSYLVMQGILGCWKSHEELLGVIADGVDDTVLILEDDAVPSNKVNWEVLLEKLPVAMRDHGMGFLQLGFVSWQFRFTRPGVIEHIRTSLYPENNISVDLDKTRRLVLGSALSGTHAYVVTRDFARSISGVNDPCWTGADGLYMRLSSMSGTDGSFPVMARFRHSLVEQVSREKRKNLTDSDVS